ncbi:hypothetical protein COV20_00425 [Candidatus Woesearchaeota archaeon CG10_big_fil_rev_8_21_14_0_10_45_16]|nr:MAG: hypothetical protein COV20_00425 [Candidatus Woesearchaeota archaeon CG10_big_fil_rev_8_21_14_0_10_45_16]
MDLEDKLKNVGTIAVAGAAAVGAPICIEYLMGGSESINAAINAGTQIAAAGTAFLVGHTALEDLLGVRISPRRWVENLTVNRSKHAWEKAVDAFTYAGAFIVGGAYGIEAVNNDSLSPLQKGFMAAAWGARIFYGSKLMPLVTTGKQYLFNWAEKIGNSRTRSFIKAPLLAVQAGAIAWGAWTIGEGALPYFQLPAGFFSSGVEESGPRYTGPYTKINHDNPMLQKQIKAGKFQSGFLEGVEEVCGRLNMHTMALLSVMYYETGGTYKTDIKNKKSSATGLIQFTRKTAKGLDTTIEELARMSQTEQLKYVEKYFSKFKGIDYSNPTNIALAVFYPKAIGKGDHYVICDTKAKINVKVCKQNRDKNGDGKLEAWEYTKPALSKGFF